MVLGDVAELDQRVEAAPRRGGRQAGEPATSLSVICGLSRPKARRTERPRSSVERYSPSLWLSVSESVIDSGGIRWGRSH